MLGIPVKKLDSGHLAKIAMDEKGSSILPKTVVFPSESRNGLG